MWRGAAAIDRQRCRARYSLGATCSPALLVLALVEVVQARRDGGRARHKPGGYAQGLYDDGPPLSPPAPSVPMPGGSPSPAPFAAPSLGLPELPTLPTLPGLPGMPSFWSAVPAMQLPGWLAAEYVVSVVVYVAVCAGVLYCSGWSLLLLYRACARAWAYCVQINWCRGKRCDDGQWYRVRDEVWVRDQLHEQWKKSTVVGFEESVGHGGVHPLCQPVGPMYTRGHTYIYVERRDPARGHVQTWGSSLWSWLFPSPETPTAQSETDSDDDFASPRGEPRRLPGSPMVIPDPTNRTDQPVPGGTTMTELYKKHAAAMSPDLVANPFSPLASAGLSLSLIHI